MQSIFTLTYWGFLLLYVPTFILTGCATAILECTWKRFREDYKQEHGEYPSVFDSPKHLGVTSVAFLVAVGGIALSFWVLRIQNGEKFNAVAPAEIYLIALIAGQLSYRFGGPLSFIIDDRIFLAHRLLCYMKGVRP